MSLKRFWVIKRNTEWLGDAWEWTDDLREAEWFDDPAVANANLQSREEHVEAIGVDLRNMVVIPVPKVPGEAVDLDYTLEPKAP